jgi:rhamnosyltransferase
MSVYAVIVTFNPDERFSKNVQSLLSQVDKIVVVDNNSKNKEALLTSEPNVKIHLNTQNVGLATALNQGVLMALEAKADWVVTFDQDSIAMGNLIAELFAAYEACPYKDKVALVAPIYKDQATGNLQAFALESATPYAPITHTMTSGSLVKATVFQHIGLFKDYFFIDYIDMEFCLRCSSNNYQLIEAHNAILLHNVGEQTEHTRLGQAFSTSNHSAMRYYYRTRNRLYVYRIYAKQQRLWIIKDIRSFIVETAKMLLAEKQRWAKVKSIAKGLRDGLIKKSREL